EPALHARLLHEREDRVEVAAGPLRREELRQEQRLHLLLRLRAPMPPEDGLRRRAVLRVVELQAEEAHEVAGDECGLQLLAWRGGAGRHLGPGPPAQGA